MKVFKISSSVCAGRYERDSLSRTRAEKNNIFKDTIFDISILDKEFDGGDVNRFVGRTGELAELSALLDRITAGGSRPGKAILIRGRRRVGKSRLVEEFVEQSDIPYLFFTASAQGSTAADISLFIEAGASSNLPSATTFDDQRPSTWDAALTLLAGALPTDRPSVVVVDEMPYLIANDPGFEGTLQKHFDRTLSRLPVLLIGIGSDLAMMEALNTYGRPFHQRATEMVVPPLNPMDVATSLSLSPADAFDAYLISGGLPLILDEWPSGMVALDYVAEAFKRSTSALLVSGERALAAEFPSESLARRVLGAIGSGERTFTSVGRAAGDLQSGSLNRAIDILTTKRIVEAARPLSTKPSRETRYTITDPHLRFWLAFVGNHMAEIERGRGDITFARFAASWITWRGRAVEPVIRESLRRLPGGFLPDEGNAVGGYWTRTNDPEIDIVVADREPIATKICAVGSVKWQERRPFDGADLARLIVHRSQLPGATEATPMIAVSRTGTSVDGIRTISPDDLMLAYPARP